MNNVVTEKLGNSFKRKTVLTTFFLGGGINYSIVILQDRYITIGTKEVACLGYNGFLFPHEYSSECLGLHLSTHAENETRYKYPIRTASFVSIVLYLIHIIPKKNSTLSVYFVYWLLCNVKIAEFQLYSRQGIHQLCQPARAFSWRNGILIGYACGVNNSRKFNFKSPLSNTKFTID